MPAVDDLTRLALAGRDGDRVALAAFVRRTQHDVVRLARHLVGPDRAEDVAQDTYLRALRALPAYRGEATARVWLLAVARRTAVDAIRATERRRRLLARAVPVTVEPDLASLVGIEVVVRSLDPDRRTAFTLTQVLGLSYAEAADVCGCAVGTIRSRVARARHELITGLAEAAG